MDCSDARACLPMLTLSSVGEIPAEVLAVHQHLEQCAACRSALRRESAGDRELSMLMSAVSLPEALSRRVHQRIAAQNAQRPVSPSSKASRRSWFWTSVSVAVLIAVTAPWLLQSLSPTSISLADWRSKIDRNRDLSGWPAVELKEFPFGWLDSAQLITQPCRGMSDPPVTLFAAEFAWHSPRSVVPVSGTLWMVQAAQIRNAEELPSLEAAQIQYGTDHGVLIWKENAFIYLVEMDGRALDQLLAMLRRSRSLA